MRSSGHRRPRPAMRPARPERPIAGMARGEPPGGRRRHGARVASMTDRPFRSRIEATRYTGRRGIRSEKGGGGRA